MYSIYIIVASIFVQSLFIDRIDANSIRRRRQQASGTLYGNSNIPGSNPAAGYNYQPNTNLYGTNLNNQVPKDLYPNPMAPSNAGNSLNMGLPNQQQQQQQQQQQMYGASGANPSFTGTGLYSPGGLNPVSGNMGMRDTNGNPIPGGTPGSSFYSPTNPQMGGYPVNTNQGLANKDAYNPASNLNNNQYGLNNNPYPNSNTFAGQQVPNNNLWPNNNNQQQQQQQQYHSSVGNTWGQNREANTNTNNNAYSNPNSPYFYNNSGHQMMTSCLVFILSFFARIYFHI